METAKTIRAVLFEDNKTIREGMQQILNASPGFACANAYANCNNLIARIENTKPDIVLMDIQMPGMNGIEGVAIIRQHFSELPVLMQTVFEDESKVFAAICAGANGYILKNTTPVKLLEAIKEAAEGGSPMTPVIAAKVLKMFRQQNPHADSTLDINLTEREKEILALLSDGLSYKMIAEKIFLSYETVHTHVRNIYKKLQVNSVSEAVSKAFRNKLV